MRIYEELVHCEMLTAHQREKFRTIVSQSLARSYDYPMLERGVNNRPYGMNGGPAVALRLFPNMPNLLHFLVEGFCFWWFGDYWLCQAIIYMMYILGGDCFIDFVCRLCGWVLE